MAQMSGRPAALLPHCSVPKCLGPTAQANCWMIREMQVPPGFETSQEKFLHRPGCDGV